MKRFVIIESPPRGDYKANRKYLKKCIRHSLSRGEAPYASHWFFNQPGILDDTDREEREMGMQAGFAWGAAAELVAVYTDRGISKGMRRGIEKHLERGVVVEYRTIGEGGG